MTHELVIDNHANSRTATLTSVQMNDLQELMDGIIEVPGSDKTVQLRVGDWIVALDRLEEKEYGCGKR